MDHDDQEEQPVSFQELKKRWAQQESTTQQQQQQQQSVSTGLTRSSSSNNVAPSGGNESITTAPSPVIASSRSVSSSKPPVPLPPKPTPVKSETSPPLPPASALSSPPLTMSPPSVSLERTISNTTIEKDQEPTITAATETLPASKGPAIPPKPTSVTLQPPSTEDTSLSNASTPLAKRVSLLAQQFDNKSAPSSPVVAPTGSTKPPVVPTPTKDTQPSATFLSPPPLHQHHQHETVDPFLDDEISDISSRDSDDDYADDDVNDEMEDAPDLDNIRYTATPPFKPSSPAIPAKGDKPKQRPPPPPPSKKYHSTARQTESINHTSGGTSALAMPIPIPVQQQQRSLTHPTNTAPVNTSSATPGISSTASSPGTGTTAPPPILPPRPANVNVASFEPLPQLPPRPSTSTLARSHTINHSYDHGYTIGGGRRTQFQDAPPLLSDGYQQQLSHPQQSSAAATTTNLKRSQTMGPTKRDGLPTTTANLLTKSVYPDFSSATRNPPLLDDSKGEQRFVGGPHRGSHQPMAASGSRLATGTQQAKVWNTTTCKTIFGVDLVGPNDNERIRSYVFAPPLRPADEGRYLWAGMLDGTLVALDTATNEIIGKTSVCHKHAITFMLRRRNVDVWTLDDSGLLAIWPVMNHAQQQQQPYHPFEMQPIKHLVTPKAVTALIVGMDLWISSGRSIHLFRGLGNNTNALSDDKPVRIPNDLGNITQLVTIPFHSGQVFASHDDGKVSAWDSKTMEKLQVNAVSLYGICSMVTVCDYYLWTGYNTGMIYVYDTRPEKWLVVKTWRAHQGAIVSLIIDDSSFVRNENSLHVISGDSHGNVAIWDGLMVENWQDQQLQKQAPNYCSYKPARVMICSWNIDANKPEKLVGQDNELVHQWLGDAEDPDIIVVGIQEIVDLESKKQTAKSLFATRKKNDTLQEAEEMLTHRYRLWHDHLIRVIGDNYGHDAYTVIKTDQLVGLFSCIFVKNSEMHRVWNCDSTVVKTGLKVMNKSIHGNKGGIAIRFLFDHSSLCFVNCHLAAGQSHTQDRNANAESILHSANFPEYGTYLDVFTNGGDGSLILDHEHCFLSGDLNYRIAMDRKDVIDMLKRKDKMAAWEALQIHDQLKRQIITNPLFKLLWFKEPPLLFDPTYKYDRGTDNYDSSEKKRVPAWCDRVLCRSSMAHNIYYRRHEVKASDHRPISAAYDIQVKEIDGQKRDRLLEKIEKDWYHSLEKLIMVKKACYVADFEQCTVEQASKLLQEAHWNVEQVVQNLF